MLATCLLIADAKGKKHKKNGEAKKAKARAGAGRINGRDSKVTFRPFISSTFRVVITLRRAHKWAQNELNLRLKVISFAIMTPSEQFYVS